MSDEDDTALSRTYVLKPSTLNEKMSLEELADLAESTDESGASTTEQLDSSQQ